MRQSSARLQLVPADWTPRMAGRAYDNLAPRWEGLLQARDEIAKRRWVYGWLEQHGFLEGGVLDMGCGSGSLLDFVPLPVERYVGIDTSLGMLSVAGLKHRDHHFVPRDFCETGFPAEQLDSVVCLFGVFSYAELPHEAVAEIYRLLRKRGRFAVMTYGPRFTRDLLLEGIKVDRNVYTAEQMQAFFQAFDKVEVRSIARATPPGWLPQFVHDWWCRFEQRSRREHGGQFLITTGEK